MIKGREEKIRKSTRGLIMSDNINSKRNKKRKWRGSNANKENLIK